MSNSPARAFSFFAAILMFAGCNSAPSEKPPLEGAAIGGPFTLVNAAGETVHWADFDGKWRMVYFGYAYCPDVCPFDVQRMAQGYEAFKRADPERAAQVVPIFITVDPERDTPEVIGEFTAAFSPDLVGLTGSPQQVKQAADNFVVYYEKGAENSAGGYLMDHTRAAYLMDREGKPIALLPVDSSAEGVTAELDKWVS